MEIFLLILLYVICEWYAEGAMIYENGIFIVKFRKLEYFRRYCNQ